MIDTPPSADALARALAQPDLTDPRHGPHALQGLVERSHRLLAERWGCRRQLHRISPVSAGPQPRLHARTSAALPAVLDSLSLDPPEDILLVCPGLAHPASGVRHQLDLVRLQRGHLDSVELAEMVTAVVRGLLPDQVYRLLPQQDAALVGGLRLDVAAAEGWTGVGRCGRLPTGLLAERGLGGYGALHLHLDLDQILALAEPLPAQRRATA